ncbi:hypothetical protein [Lysobacter sp. cf310]|uniref:hypothetical protein n=1 Tax=Lysobacter sp. cf310 TaxID=1761790 RepID=UPI001113D769|nr:hypothetical protein [Lysobacter sp. cf310]
MRFLDPTRPLSRAARALHLLLQVNLLWPLPRFMARNITKHRERLSGNAVPLSAFPTVIHAASRPHGAAPNTPAATGSAGCR